MLLVSDDHGLGTLVLVIFQGGGSLGRPIHGRNFFMNGRNYFPKGDLLSLVVSAVPLAVAVIVVPAFCHAAGAVVAVVDVKLHGAVELSGLVDTGHWTLVSRSWREATVCLSTSLGFLFGSRSQRLGFPRLVCFSPGANR